MKIKIQWLPLRKLFEDSGAEIDWAAPASYTLSQMTAIAREKFGCKLGYAFDDLSDGGMASYLLTFSSDDDAVWFKLKYC